MARADRLGVMVLGCLMALAAGASPSRAQTLVINEVDYDQAGSDTAEFIELKNVSGAGVDLSGYTIELVNGSGGGAAVYRTIALPAARLLPPGAYHVVCGDGGAVRACDQAEPVATDLIQNGAPDAIGLREPGGALIDSVSYEGDVPGYVEGTGVVLIDNPSLEVFGIARSPDGVDTNVNAADFSVRPVTPGADNELACGDGDLDAGELCDDGVANGSAGSCCTATCVFAAAGSGCGDGTDDACTNPDTCDGSGSCERNDEVAGQGCGDGTDDACTNPDTCDGSGSCERNDEVAGQGCGDGADDACTNPDTCDGSGSCQANHEPAGTGCGDAGDGACTDPDVCDGGGACQSNHAPAGTACGDATDDACTDPDACDGGGACQSNQAPAGTACGDATDGACTDPDACDGGGACATRDAADGTSCPDDGVECSSDACAAGACTHPPRPEGTACGDATDAACTDPDTCDAAGACASNDAAGGAACPGDGAFCTGVEACVAGECTSPGDPCDDQTETCDDARDVCVAAACGDGAVEAAAACDDGNTAAGDGCTACAVDAGWSCGDLDPADGTSECAETCGDGALDPLDGCDDGNLMAGDGCDARCSLEDGYECERGATADVCAPVCGDGLTVGAEACDDGNATAGDGCAGCVVEDGYECDISEPTICVEQDLAEGCGCRAGDDGAPGGALALLLLGLVLARRRRSARVGSASPTRVQ